VTAPDRKAPGPPARYRPAVLSDQDVSARARRLARAIEPVAGQVYFSPECHEGYAALGFNPSPAKAGGVALPDGPAYFCSRGSVLGQVPGELVASAFAVFNPAVVVPAVAYGWTLTDAPTIAAARTNGAMRQLQRILGSKPDGVDRAEELLERANGPLRPEGKPLYAGMLAQPRPDEPIGRVWRLADRLREYRGDAHTASWTTAGFDATEIGLLSELFWGLKMRTYIRTRAWSESELDAAEARLDERGLTADGAFTDAGRAAREAVEAATDRHCRPIVEALGDDLDDLLGVLEPWGAAIRAGGGYLTAGPDDLARTR
jgi:hypothetical protein